MSCCLLTNTANFWTKNLRAKYRPVLTVWILIVTVSFLSPVDQVPQILQWTHSDKVLHFVIFAITALLIHLSFERLSIWSLLAFGTIYGLILEVIQIYIPGRSFELMDLLSDIGGTLIGSLAFTYFNSR